MTARLRPSVGLTLVAVAAFVVFLPTLQNDFVLFDDDQYIFNAAVQNGLSARGLAWAFTTGHAANYHPVTWLSHMTDVSLFGLNPAGHHLTNVLLHALNSSLVFLVLLRMTGAPGRAAVAGLLFAVHPLHVESVAWVSERKDLLCACFMLASALAYYAYTQRRQPLRYGVLVLLFALALLSKPMAVTLPFVFLLLDFWPLRRLSDTVLADTFPKRVRLLVIEKVPLLVVSAIFSAITFAVQRRGGAMNPLEDLPLVYRAGNAALAYVRYLYKTAVPIGLSPIYPHPGREIAWAAVTAAALLVIAVSLVAWQYRRRFPYLISGWLLFLGMLVPVIGLVQVGYTAMADRYMYLPILGIIVAGVWWTSDSAVTRPYGVRAAQALVVGIVLIFSMLSVRQGMVWRTSETLFQHAISVDPTNAEAHAHLGVAYLTEDRPADAILALQRAVELDPEMKEALTSLGVAYRMTGRLDDAVGMHERALALSPGDAAVHTNLAITWRTKGDLAKAERHLQDALRLDDQNETAHRMLAEVLTRQNRVNEAAAHQAEAERLAAEHDRFPK